MKKDQLIAELQKHAPGATKTLIAQVIDGLPAVVGKALAGSDGEVSLPGIGKLHVVISGERQGKNPGTGEVITIAANRHVKFKASQALKDAVRR